MRRSVEKDIYRMRQFVRFRKVETSEGPNYVAWYEPEHHTLDANGKFFVGRFGSMRWAILTPGHSLIWNLKSWNTGPGVPRLARPPGRRTGGPVAVVLRDDFQSSPAEAECDAGALPVGRWNNLPESRMIPELVRMSRGRVDQMIDSQPLSASDFIPQGASLTVCEKPSSSAALVNFAAARRSRFGAKGTREARIALVGEQPGDEEDLRDALSSARPERFWTTPWRQPGWSEAIFISPTR